MKKVLYAIRDNLTFDYEMPVCYTGDLECLRALATQVGSEKLKFEQGKIDFDPSIQHGTRSLYAIGYYFPMSGTIEAFEPKLVCVISDAPNLYKKMLLEFHPDLSSNSDDIINN